MSSSTPALSTAARSCTLDYIADQTVQNTLCMLAYKFKTQSHADNSPTQHDRATVKGSEYTYTQKSTSFQVKTFTFHAVRTCMSASIPTRHLRPTITLHTQHSEHTYLLEQRARMRTPSVTRARRRFQTYPLRLLQLQSTNENDGGNFFTYSTQLDS